MERYLEIAFLAGVASFALAVCASLLLIISSKLRQSKALWRTMFLAVTVAIVGMLGPAAVTRFVPPDLGPHQSFVGSERHVTLTGWDRKDYSILQRIPDAALLQMANPDVGDTEVGYLLEMSQLRELDLGHTAITDQALLTLVKLPALERLHINNTAITTGGLAAQLPAFPKLRLLDVRGTSIDREILTQWKAAAPGRRVLGP